MDYMRWLLGKIPIPFIVHHSQKILFANQAFINLLLQEQSLDKLNFKRWLTTSIQSKKSGKLLLQAIDHDNEITLDVECYVKGVLRHFRIVSVPIPNKSPADKTQLTFLQDIALNSVQRAYWDLHLRVSQATTQLTREMEERKEIENEMSSLNNELILVSRRAGMADIATSVLHNIGNVLTSANTSITLVSNKISASKLSNLDKITQLLQVHANHIGEFLTTDPQGLHLSHYLLTLSKQWSEEKDFLMEELSSLKSNIEHIKEIISKQNELSLPLDAIQKVTASVVMEEALKLNQFFYENTGITIIRKFFPVKQINLDRIKTLQILVNLIKNSIESLLMSTNKNKQITLSISEDNSDFLIMDVIDNGLGISPENLNRVFHQGFTTKKNGYGFGLHASILSAQQMQGSLSVKSEGIGKGAIFTLSLPYKRVKENDNK